MNNLFEDYTWWESTLPKQEHSKRLIKSSASHPAFHSHRNVDVWVSTQCGKLFSLNNQNIFYGSEELQIIVSVMNKNGIR